MTGSDASKQGSNLAYQLLVPFRCHEELTAPSAAALAAWDDANEEVLKVIYMLDELAPEGREETSEHSPEFARIDLKLNVLFDMMGMLLTHYTSLPPAAAVTLGTQSLQWQGSQALPVGDLIRLELFLSPRYPRPLMLCARIQETTAVAEGCLLTASYEQVGELTRDWLAKLIFRHHRRHIAQTRRA